MKGRTLLAMALLAVGTGLLLDRLDHLDFAGVLSTWWPSLLVLIGLVQLLTQSGNTWLAAVLLAVGLLLQASRLGWIPALTAELILPLILLAAGAALLLARSRPAPPASRAARGGRDRATGGSPAQEGRLHRLVAFGGSEERVGPTPFTGGEVTALFGGAKVDLRDATLPAEGATLDVTAAFGGVEVVVPTGWRVQMRGTPLFGGFQNKAALGRTESGSLRITGLAMFGGVEVHN